MLICINELSHSDRDNDMFPAMHQAITQTNGDILSIAPWGTNFTEILFKI